MKTRLVALSILAAALMAASFVRAESGDGGRFGHRFGGRGPNHNPEGPNPERVERFHRHETPVFGRMSPEERRQLRHDIRSAREDVYRRPPPPYVAPSR